MHLYSIDKSKRNYTHPSRPRYAFLDHSCIDNKTPKKIKVISYNIKYAKKISKAINMLKKEKDLACADIICLQEMDPEGVDKIAHALKYNYVYYPSVVHPLHGKDFGNAVLSKWPIVKDKKIILPQKNKKNLQRIAVRATIKISKKKLMVFSVHVKVFLKKKDRQEQMETILNSIPKDITHCVVTGDFNTFTKANSRATIAPFIEKEFNIASEDTGWTFKKWYLLNKKKTPDHIFTKGMKILSKGKVVKRGVSDHVPIWTELGF